MLLVPRAGQGQGEGRSRAEAALYFDGAAEFGRDDVVDDGEAEAGALTERLGGEHGIEDALHHFRRDPGAPIDDLELYSGAARAERKCDGAAPLGLAGIDGVGDQVGHDLCETAGETEDLDGLLGVLER